MLARRLLEETPCDERGSVTVMLLPRDTWVSNAEAERTSGPWVSRAGSRQLTLCQVRTVRQQQEKNMAKLTNEERKARLEIVKRYSDLHRDVDRGLETGAWEWADDGAIVRAR